MPKKKKNSRFTEEQLEHYRLLILQKMEDLFKELGYLKEFSMETSLKEYSGNHSTYSFHMADQGTDAQEREKAFLFAHREGRYLDHLERALERIENGTYGSCLECGEPISEARLEAVPHARLCIECKSTEESKR